MDKGDGASLPSAFACQCLIQSASLRRRRRWQSFSCKSNKLGVKDRNATVRLSGTARIRSDFALMSFCASRASCDKLVKRTATAKKTHTLSSLAWRDRRWGANVCYYNASPKTRHGCIPNPLIAKPNHTQQGNLQLQIEEKLHKTHASYAITFLVLRWVSSDSRWNGDVWKLSHFPPFSSSSSYPCNHYRTTKLDHQHSEREFETRNKTLLFWPSFGSLPFPVAVFDSGFKICLSSHRLYPPLAAVGCNRVSQINSAYLRSPG